MKKHIWYNCCDVAFVLVLISVLFSDYQSYLMGTICRFCGLLLFLSAKFVCATLYGENLFLTTLHSLGWTFVVLSIQLRCSKETTIGVFSLSILGIAIVLFSRYFIYKNHPRVAPIWIKITVALLILVRLGLPLATLLSASMKHGHTGESPFEHHYRIDRITKETSFAPINENAPLIYISYNKALYLMPDTTTYEWALIGEFQYIGQTPDNKSTQYEMWECVSIDNPDTLYKLSTDEDSTVCLSYYEKEDIKWSAVLSRVDTLICSVQTSTIFSSPTPDWFAEKTFNGDTKYLSFGDVKNQGTITFSWREDSPACMLVEEEYFTSTTVKKRDYTLYPNENGEFVLPVEALTDDENQYAIYRIPYEEGEYVFGVRYS